MILKKKFFSISDTRITLLNGEYYCGGNLATEALSYFYSHGYKTYLVCRVVSSADPKKNNTLLPNWIHVINLSNFWVRYLGCLFQSSCVFYFKVPTAASKLFIPFFFSRNICVTEVIGNELESYRYHSRFGAVIAPFSYLLSLLLVAKSHYTAYITTSYLQKLYFKPSRYCFAGVDNLLIPDNLFVSSAQLSVIAAKIYKAIQSKSIVVGYIGSYDVKYKNHLMLHRFAARLQEFGFDVKLKVVSRFNPNFSSRHSHILKNFPVEISNGLDRGDIYGWLRSLDIYFHPSLTEGMGRSIVEAMSQGIPVVASDVGGIRELLDSSQRFNPKSCDDAIQAFSKICKSYTSLYHVIAKQHLHAESFMLSRSRERRHHFYSEILKLTSLR